MGIGKSYPPYTLNIVMENWVSGNLIFSANYQFQQIDDEYLIEVVIPDTYPDSLPTVREKGNRIVGGFRDYMMTHYVLGLSCPTT